MTMSQSLLNEVKFPTWICRKILRQKLPKSQSLLNEVKFPTKEEGKKWEAQATVAIPFK